MRENTGENTSSTSVIQPDVTKDLVSVYLPGGDVSLAESSRTSAASTLQADVEISLVLMGNESQQ